MDSKIRQYSSEVSPGSSGGMNRSRKIIWAVFGVLLILIIGVILLIPHKRHSHFPVADQERTTTFEGMSSFVDNGLTTDQVNSLTQDFSKFSPSAKTVSVDSSSLSPGPHTPGDPDFTINFRASVDSAAYRGVVHYSGLETVRLILYSSSGNQVFDSK